jgi:DNA-binding NtrC family response regulator
MTTARRLSGTILVVEDERTQREMLSAFLAGHGLSVRTADSVASGTQALREAAPDLLLTDYDLPDGTGLDLLVAARALPHPPGGVVLTAYGTVPMAVKAMQEGAFDVQLKPVEPEALLHVLARALAPRVLARENQRLRERLAARDAEGPFAAQSPRMRAFLHDLDRVAPTDATVLLTGESGTGKELAAQRLHQRGRRAEGPLVAVHAAALPESLLESELFGHARGAFTGAVAERRGRFEEAGGGTLFLDEIGELPASVQVRLLRVLQEREITRVGENLPRPVDVRLVAATHRDLAQEVAAGRFREDLYYRLDVVHLHVPPLRERREDIPRLVDRLAREAADRHGIPPRPFSAGAVAALLRRPFPGNVRELRNVVERCVLLAPGEEIAEEDLPADGRAAAGAAPALAGYGSMGLEDALAALEAGWIRRALGECDGVQTRAAERLGIAERVLRYKMRKHGIDRPGATPDPR